MKILAFVYDFPHIKSCQNLLALACAGFKDVTCLAAPKKNLDIISSRTRITPVIEPFHPEDVAKALGFEYVIKSHDEDFIWPKNRFDVGVILGARILKPHVVNALSIINMHPGYLPNNRNLDNIKWAIIDRIPQAVTTHIVDENVDRGRLIDKKIVPVYYDDTILDIFLRLQNTETIMMIEALEKFGAGEKFTTLLGKGTYYDPLPDYLDSNLEQAFRFYKEFYKNICDDFLSKKAEAS